MSFLFGSNKNKTFRPKKSLPEGSHQYELLKHAEATLGSGNLRSAVMLPEVRIFLNASEVITMDVNCNELCYSCYSRYNIFLVAMLFSL